MRAKKQINRIIHLYTIKLLPSTKISKIFNCSKKTILDILKNNNIKRRDSKNCKISNNYNREYFKKIDSEEKAYFLGLLYADGCNHNKKGFSIYLQEEDKYLIYKLRKCLNATKLKIIKVKKIKPHHKNKVGLSVTSCNMAEDLNKLGMIPRKSLVLEFPTPEQVPDYLIHHFIRGYFDGDGCISLTKRKRKFNISIEGVSNITSSTNFCLKLNKIFENLKIRFNLLNRFKGKTCSTLYTGGTFNLIKLYNYIYKDCNIFMKRKRILFEKLFKIKNFKLDGTKMGKGKSKYRGVYVRNYEINDKIYTYIRAMIIFNKKRIELGKFNTELEAANAYDKKCLELYKDKAILNFR